jgi:hypothetical protein
MLGAAPQRDAALRLCTSCSESLESGVMGNRKGRIAALCGGAAVLALALGGVGGVGEPQLRATAPSSSVVPAPPSPGDTGGGGGALPVKPAGGGGCILGLNCGPIRPNPPPPPHRQPSLPHDPQHPAPAPQNP